MNDINLCFSTYLPTYLREAEHNTWHYKNVDVTISPLSLSHTHTHTPTYLLYSRFQSLSLLYPLFDSFLLALYRYSLSFIHSNYVPTPVLYQSIFEPCFKAYSYPLPIFSYSLPKCVCVYFSLSCI